jgi:hypothetical protein
MANNDLHEYVRKNLPTFGEASLREQLLRDGVAAKDIDSAISATKTVPPAPRKRRGLALIAVILGGLLIIAAGIMGSKSNKKAVTPVTAAEEEFDDGIYYGHYGFLFKLPAGYAAHNEFRDPRKTEEVVYVYPKGTSHNHLIHEGLFGSLGILRLEVLPRRVPQGYVGIDTLKAFVKSRLEHDKAAFSMRDLNVNGKPAFIVNAEKPFKYSRAYLVGQKVRYTLVGGEENSLFIDVLSSLHEASPHDRPGE